MQQIIKRSQRRTKDSIPFLFVLMFFFATFSCSSIWFAKCVSRF